MFSISDYFKLDQFTQFIAFGMIIKSKDIDFIYHVSRKNEGDRMERGGIKWKKILMNGSQK